MSGSREHGTLLPALSLAAPPGRDPAKGLSHHGLQSSHLQKAPEHRGALRHGALTMCLAGHVEPWSMSALGWGTEEPTADYTAVHLLSSCFPNVCL